MGRVGDENSGAAGLSPVPEIRLKQLHAREFPLSSGEGGKGSLLHSRDLTEAFLKALHQLQGSLGIRPILKGMKFRESGKTGGFFVHLGVVLHGTGPQGIKPHIHPEVLPGKVGVVPNQIQLGYLGKPGSLDSNVLDVDTFGTGDPRNRCRIKIVSPAAGSGFIENYLISHVLPPGLS